MSKRVLVAMSGGIDSSVTAKLLLEQGYDVSGITMCLADSPFASLTVAEAENVARFLGIEHEVADFSDDFELHVIGDFIDQYHKGRTPNPCIRCNRVIKFGKLLHYALEKGFDLFATGHYATLQDGFLRRGTDSYKDQSYFLYPIYGSEYMRVLFPLGTWTKDEVRSYAEKAGLPNARKGESQDICFIPNGKYADFFSQREISTTEKGPIKDTMGRIIGYHRGVHNFTIGQRKGLGALGKPMFVKEIQPESNCIIAAEDVELFSSDILIVKYISGPEPLSENEEYLVQVRYRSAPIPARLLIADSAIQVHFSEPVRAVAPGQSAVIYRGDMVAGGGIIERG